MIGAGELPIVMPSRFPFIMNVRACRHIRIWICDGSVSGWSGLPRLISLNDRFTQFTGLSIPRGCFCVRG
jgi:hypothetical protein